MSIFDILLIIWLVVAVISIVNLLAKKKYNKAGHALLVHGLFGALLGMGWYLQTKPLWGYWTIALGVLLFAYFFVQRFPKFQSIAGKNNLITLSLLSGVLLSVGFPPLPFVVLLLGGFVPLLWVEHQVSESNLINKRKAIFGYSYLTFVLWNILTTYWIMNSSFLSGVMAVLINSFLMTLPFIAFHESKKYLPKTLAYLALPIFWLTFEYLHFRWELAFPWLTLGNGLSKTPILAQWYEITGVLGGSLWILVVNITLFIFIKKGIANQNWKTGWWTPLLLILIPSIISYFLYQKNTTTADKQQVEIVVVQPNYEPIYEEKTIPEEEKIRHFQQLAAEVLTDSTTYLVFPETSFGSIWKYDIGVEDALTEFRDFIKVYPDLQLITGISLFGKIPEGEPIPPSARPFNRGQDTLFFYNQYNAAVQLSSSSDSIPVHIKTKLVVGAEKIPFDDWMKGLGGAFEIFGGSSTSLGEGKEATVFEHNNIKIAPIICYEQDFGDYLTSYVEQGAQALIIMTNDGWWDNTSGYRQHLEFASLRAIETRRAIARSANTGTSAFINTRGDIMSSTSYNEATAMKGKLSLNDTITFYVRYGDYIGRYTMYLSAILLLWMIGKRLSNKTMKP